MAKQDFVRFYQEYLPKNPDLKRKIDGITNEQEFAKAVLDAGPKAGFKFSQSEVEEVMKASETGVTTAELSDDQLDAVAGGAGIALATPTVQISSIESRTNIIDRALIDPGKVASTIMCCW
jgi:predicted ribosomally synthesized peptide with nif11-like leader